MTTEVQELSYAEKMALLDNKARQQQIDDEKKRQDELKKNHDFVQFQRKGLDMLAQLDNLLAHRIFLFLAREMDTTNAIIVSQTVLAEIFGVSRQSVNTAVKALTTSKLLTILRSGGSNIYCLNANVVWSTDRTKIETAKFKAEVIISKKEQTKTKVKRTKHKQLTIPEL